MPLIPSSIPPVFHSSQPIFIGRTSWSPTSSPIRASLPSLTGSSPHYLHPRSLNISCSLSITPHRRIATPYVPRNVRDQPAFDTFTGEAEANKNSEGDQGHLQIAVVSIFVIQLHFISNFLRTFSGTTPARNFLWTIVEYWWGLLKQNVWRIERDVWHEVSDSLGKDLVSAELSRSVVKALVLEHQD